MNIGIYSITNISNGFVYVGSAVDIRKRWRQHVNSLHDCKHHNIKLQCDWLKDGEANFSFKPLLYCAKEHLLLYEQQMINAYMETNLCYNILPFAGNCSGRIVSAETRQKISRALLGRPRPEHVRRKMRLVNKGIKRSEEFKNNLSIMWRGKPQSAEHVKKRVAAYLAAGHKPSALTIQKAREWKLGRKQSPETIAKRAAALRGKKRGPMSEEQKTKISICLKGRERAPEAVAKMLATKAQQKQK